MPCVDAPGNASVFYGDDGKCGRVPTCVRPLVAAIGCRGPLWIVRRPGPNRNRAVRAARGITGSPDLVILDFSPITLRSEPPHSLASAATVRRRAEPGKLRLSSSRPMPYAPFCWPRQQRPAFLVCGPAFAPATILQAHHRAAQPPGSPTSPR